VALGWRNIIGYDFTGGPRYVATNLAHSDGTKAAGVSIELFGREFGDFMGALLEGAELRVYGQAQSHCGLKADSGYLFVLQDALNTCMYAAHGGTISLWDSGSRFAVAGQNKVHLADGKTPAPGFKSIHFGTPNEYAFEYLMSGGENSLHVVMGLSKPDARGEIALKPKPYGGKFFMSGAAAGRVYVFDPGVKLDPAQYHGNVLSAISPEEWARELGPFVAREAARRGVPVRIEGEHITVRLEGEWRRWRYDEAFAKLIPVKVAKAAQEQGVVAPQLAQIVAE
jgi:glutamate synthase domain-containing protein 3